MKENDDRTNPCWIESEFKGVKWTPEAGLENEKAPPVKPGIYCNSEGVPRFEIKEDGTVINLLYK